MGAICLGRSLRDACTNRKLALLITNNVSAEMRWGGEDLKLGYSLLHISFSPPPLPPTSPSLLHLHPLCIVTCFSSIILLRMCISCCACNYSARLRRPSIRPLFIAQWFLTRHLVYPLYRNMLLCHYQSIVHKLHAQSHLLTGKWPHSQAFACGLGMRLKGSVPVH